jgi:hypothetical protein
MQKEANRNHRSSEQEVERLEVEGLLNSEAFVRSPLQARLLKFLADTHFSGRRENLNEYTIAVEALGRPSEFDPALNSAVRVTMHRLREKLRRYYETEGADHPVRIFVEEGHYGLHFYYQGISSPARSISEADHSGPHTEPAQQSSVTQSAQNGQLELTASAGKGWWRSRYRGTASIWVIGGLALVSLLIAFWFLAGNRRPGMPTEKASLPSSNAMNGTLSAPSEDGAIRILAGYTKSRYIDREGRVWSGDRYFNGGDASEADVPYVEGAMDPSMFRTFRSGNFSYDIPVKPGIYELRLTFVETTYGPDTDLSKGEASRVFSVLLNNQPILRDLDVLSDAGRDRRVLTRVFRDVTPDKDGKIHLAFRRRNDQSIVSAIELIPEVKGKIDPVRLVMQEHPFFDSAGRMWKPDQYFVGGVSFRHPHQIQGTADPHLFDSERFGRFFYQIPAAPGCYSVTFYLDEAYFGTSQAAPDYRDVNSNRDARLFNIYTDGRTLAQNLNILQEAGGPNRPLIKTFHGIEPNAVGQIVLNFSPIKEHASVDAIEVTYDSPSCR